MTEEDILKRIYPSVVTYMGDWQQMIKDVKRLKLERISLFLTGVGYRDRQKIYQLLQDTLVKSIPHVHARNDMKEEEFDLLVKTFKTKAFTMHFQYMGQVHNSKHRKKIFIENNWGRSGVKELKPLERFGGACIDLSHLKDCSIHHVKDYEMAVATVKRFRVGCNHLSAVLPDGKSWHYAKNTSEFDYVTEIPKKYFSSYINLEVGNPIPEQLKFKKYIAKKLFKAWNQKS